MCYIILTMRVTSRECRRWLGNENVDANIFRIPNFSLYYTNLKEIQNYGVMVYIHNSVALISYIEISTQTHTVLEIQFKK